MTDRLDILLADVDGIAALDRAGRSDCVRRATWVRSATRDEVHRFLCGLLERDTLAEPYRDGLIAEAFQHLVARQRGAVEGVDALELDDGVLQHAATLYRRLAADGQAKVHLLCLLTGSRRPAALAAFAELVVDDPPDDMTQVASAFGPLFQHKDYDAAALFQD